MTVGYEQWAPSYGQHRRHNQDVVDALVAGARLTAASSILEVGAGTGNYSRALSCRLGCRCTAAEPSDAMRSLLQAAGSDVHAVAASAEQLPLPSESFDLVFCVDVAHHLADPAAFFAEAFRVLRAAGDVCVVTDSEDIIRSRFPLAEYFPETVAADLERYPSVGRLRSQAEAAGFVGWRESEVRTEGLLSSAAGYEAKAFSVLHLIPSASFETGLARLRADLARGPLVSIARYVLLWASKGDRSCLEPALRRR